MAGETETRAEQTLRTLICYLALELGMDHTAELLRMLDEGGEVTP